MSFLYPADFVNTNDDRWHQANLKLSVIGATLVHTKADDRGRCDIVDSCLPYTINC